jgi:hypothetical protein
MNDRFAKLRSISWLKYLFIVLALEALWFGLLSPPFPSSFGGAFFEFVVGLFVLAIFYGSTNAIKRLNTSSFQKPLATGLIGIVAVGALILVILAAYLCSAFITNNLPFAH